MILRYRRILPLFHPFVSVAHQASVPRIFLRRKFTSSASDTSFIDSSNTSAVILDSLNTASSSYNSKLSTDDCIPIADKSSPTLRGTLLELSALDALALYGMHLSRVGGKSDRGVDLRGYWYLPRSVGENNNEENNNEENNSKENNNEENNNEQNNNEENTELQSVYVIVQCKNFKTGCVPDHMRSLIGAMVQQNTNVPMIGLLVSSSKFSKQLVHEFKGCPAALGLAIVAEGKLQSLMLNLAAEKLLPGYAITTTYQEDGETVTLTYDGKAVKFM